MVNIDKRMLSRHLQMKLMWGMTEEEIQEKERLWKAETTSKHEEIFKAVDLLKGIIRDRKR